MFFKKFLYFHYNTTYQNKDYKMTNLLNDTLTMIDELLTALENSILRLNDLVL